MNRIDVYQYNVEDKGILMRWKIAICLNHLKMMKTGDVIDTC